MRKPTYATPDVIITYIIWTITTCSTVARLYTRQHVLRQTGWDDYLIIVATVLGCVMLGLHHHLTQDAITISTAIGEHGKAAAEASIRPVVVHAEKLLFAKSLVYPTQFFFIKMSLLAFYARFALRKSAKMVLYAIAIASLLFTIAVCVATIFQCHPIHAFWDYYLPRTACRVNGFGLQLGNSSFNLITDITILLLPIPIVRGLKTSPKKKAALVCLFLIGFIGTIATLVRLCKAIVLIQPPAKDTIDQFLGTINLLFWSELELNVASVCANLPAIAALWKTRRGARFDSQGKSIGTAGSGSGYGYGYGYGSGHGASANRKSVGGAVSLAGYRPGSVSGGAGSVAHGGASCDPSSYAYPLRGAKGPQVTTSVVGRGPPGNRPYGFPATDEDEEEDEEDGAARVGLGGGNGNAGGGGGGGVGGGGAEARPHQAMNARSVLCRTEVAIAIEDAPRHQQQRRNSFVGA
ncbi:MAG: hypothetical protein M1826_005583 [Phylliscum demangeonii]|nr:MAG: hypothetical protein M1826_005583 [Phylliscum demangeonii]